MAMVGVARGDGGEETRPIVSGFERFPTEAGKTDAVGGRLLMGELNCVSCHQGTDAPLAPVARKQAPILDRVGSRVQVEHLRAYLADPRQVKPGTTMPNLLAGLPKEEAEANVEALVHFLAGTGSTVAKAPIRKLVGPGRTLYTQAGCAACHGVPDDKSPALATSVPLGDLAGKYTAASLTAFLVNPLECRPSGRMPSLNLKDVEAQSIASYLLKDVKVETPPWLAYRYYEGDWDKLPDLNALAPVASGMAEAFDVSPARRRVNYALRFEGTFEVDRPGSYQFFTSSDDGSRVSVDDKVVVANDGIHANNTKGGRDRLAKGRHKVVVEYFQGGGEDELDVEFEGPGSPRRPLASDLVPPDGAKPAAAEARAPMRFVIDPVQADKGRALFASLGCASCHQLKEADKAVEPRPASSPLAALKPDAGCLASDPPKGVPDYDLSPRQRAAIAAAQADEPAKQSKFVRFAHGLYEVLGLAYRDGWLYVTQRGELTRIKDTDGDGVADRYETVSDAWEINGDYHEYAFGSKFDRDGKLWVALCLTGSFTSENLFRGWALRVGTDGKVTPACSGLRSPGGLGMNAAGDMFYTENQGPWNGACALKHLKPGSFPGNPSGNKWYEVAKEMGPRPIDPKSGSRMMVVADKIPELLPPAVYFPYPKMGQSASGIACDQSGGKFGVFGGQMFVGDQAASWVMRISLEQVDGKSQGACIPFRSGFASGVLPMLFAPDGSMIVSGTNRGWGSRGQRPYSLQRLVWTGRVPFEILDVHAKPDGFELTFTKPADPKAASDPVSYKVATHAYIYQSSYGSPEVDQVECKVEKATVAADGKSVRLVVGPLQRGHVHTITAAGVATTEGVSLLHPEVYYTLNSIPKD